MFVSKPYNTYGKWIKENNRDAYRQLTTKQVKYITEQSLSD